MSRAHVLPLPPTLRNQSIDPDTEIGLKYQKHLLFSVYSFLMILFKGSVGDLIYEMRR